jgi:hypothetical protein
VIFGFPECNTTAFHKGVGVMKKIAGIVSFFFLFTIGCSSIRYTEPTTGPTARVRFAVDTESVTVVWGYKTENCENEEEWMRLRNGPLVNSSPKTLGMPLWNYHKNAAKEFYVSTERPLIVIFKGSETSFEIRGVVTYLCAVPIIYQFEDKDYEVSFNWHKKQCTVDVFEIVKTESGAHEKRLLKAFDNKVRFNNADCMKAFKKLRLY